MQTLLIIPTYNECENIAGLIAAVQAQKIAQLEVLVVDDNSPDGTANMVREFFINKDHGITVHLLNRPEKAGLGKAYVAGFKWALARDYDLVLQMDADFSHDPRYLSVLVDAAEHSADVVLGSRYVPGGGTRNWGWIRQLISRGGGWYARTLLGIPVRDLTGGFKCFRKEVLAAIDLDALHSAGYSFQIEMTYRCLLLGYRVQEVPIIFEDRRVGESKMSRDIVLEALINVFKLRLNKAQLIKKVEHD